jgi:uncharacterized membrane protein YraQ (UPF0718 family)
MELLLIITGISTFISLLFNRRKTFLGIKKGLKMFIGILPMFINVLILVSIFLFFVPPEVLVKWLGKNSGWFGIFISAVLGSISLIPGFIAYPLCSILIKNGVSYKIVAIFITTLMMVGILTLPIEVKYFGMKVSVLRNVLSFFGAIIIGLIIGVFL